MFSPNTGLRLSTKQNPTPQRGREHGKPLAQIIVADTERAKANYALTSMYPFEEAEHCEFFTDAERSAIMAAVNRVKADARRQLCDHIGGIPSDDISLYQAVHCSKCGKKLGTVIPTSDGGKRLA